MKHIVNVKHGRKEKGVKGGEMEKRAGPAATTHFVLSVGPRLFV